MDFALEKDQELIKKSAREFFEKECPKDKVRELREDPKGYDPNMWKKMTSLGFLGLIIPEQYGGTEGEFIDLMLFMEEIGRNLVPSPFFSTVVLCGMPLMEFGTNEQKDTFLPEIAEKGKIWSFAQTEQLANHEPEDIKLKATLDNDEYTLNGTKLFVPYASAAKYFLVVARTSEGENPEEGITLFIVDSKTDGIETEIIPTTARDVRCEVKFTNAKVPKKNILGEPDKGWKIVDYVFQNTAVLKAAEMSGGAQAAFSIVNKYAKERKQFDKPIGSLQAVQFKLVDLLTDIDELKYLVHEAAWNINAGSPSRKLNSMAKAKANAVYHDMCYHGIFLHGAIGWTEEMDIGLYHLRTRSLEFEGGGTDIHMEKIAKELESYQPDFLNLK
ncbi:MAG: acyl-CoA/acyl-ACP dehydrogenase [Deltaproteobacteria bacterium]|nr:acyl-CoA/acyl-ACP dehydrogenase [Deltaproteobacteria bacterium]